MSEIRLLALDLDGTILGADRPISARTRVAVARAMEGGVRVILASGRMYRSALPYVESLDLDGPLICYQGAYIRERPAADGSPGAILRHLTMSAEVAREAVRWSRRRGLDAHVNRDDRLVMEVGDEAAPDYERSAGIGARFVPDLLAEIDGPVTKIVAVGRPGEPAAVLDDARADFAARAEVTVSHPEYLEFVAAGVHKGAALAWLADRLGIPMSATMAVGDQLNDLEMVAMAGIGVAMGGAPAAVRAAAAHVTGPVAEDGAARAIERFVLGRPVRLAG